MTLPSHLSVLHLWSSKMTRAGQSDLEGSFVVRKPEERAEEVFFERDPSPDQDLQILTFSTPRELVFRIPSTPAGHDDVCREKNPIFFYFFGDEKKRMMMSFLCSFRKNEAHVPLISNLDPNPESVTSPLVEFAREFSTAQTFPPVPPPPPLGEECAVSKKMNTFVCFVEFWTPTSSPSSRSHLRLPLKTHYCCFHCFLLLLLLLRFVVVRPRHCLH